VPYIRTKVQIVGMEFKSQAPMVSVVISQ